MRILTVIAAAVLTASIAASGSALAAQVGHGPSGHSGAGGRIMHAPSIGHAPSLGRSFSRPSTNFSPRHIAKPFNGGGWKGKPYPGTHVQFGGNFGGRHGHRRHRGAFWYAAPPLYDDYAYSYDYAVSDCSVLWDRYLRTGNPKWNYRYYECTD